MKKNTIKSIALTSVLASVLFSSAGTAFADVISDVPYEAEGSGQTDGTDTDTGVYYAPKPESKKQETAETAAVLVIGGSDIKKLSDTQEKPEEKTDRLDLGFTVVSPIYIYNEKKVAEGRIQLKNGTWVTIDHEYYLRDPYYRLLREETDSSGTQWYVTAAHASFLGNFHTPGKNVVKELWLKKTECTAADSIHIDISNEKRGEIVKTALSLLGKQYKRAGNGPEAFDCSGFVNYVFSQSGISVPRNSGAICGMSGKVDVSQLKPGDICAKSGHVGIYIGNDTFVHACDTSNGVVSEKLSSYNEKKGFKYYINVFGD